MVNVAYDAPVDNPPKTQIEDTEKRLFELAEKGSYGSGFESFDTALYTAIDMASNAYKPRRAPVRHGDRPCRSRPA